MYSYIELQLPGPAGSAKNTAIFLSLKWHIPYVSYMYSLLSPSQCVECIKLDLDIS